jgi:hypothetical protein
MRIIKDYFRALLIIWFGNVRAPIAWMFFLMPGIMMCFNEKADTRFWGYISVPVMFFLVPMMAMFSVYLDKKRNENESVEEPGRD